MAKNIMIQGTASSVGKSIIAAGLCRIFLQDGNSVAPFKSQNMALNSFVTKEGGEMGRAQVVQAEACKIEPSVLMNPILLKPTSDKKAQVIVNGKIFRNMNAREYHDYKPNLKPAVMEAYNKLQEQFQVIVIEGAGSPAEINLKENDLVNMGMAAIADAPVLLVADIDRGGVFASILGTILLLDEDEKKRVKGIIINKFRGDVDILNPGIIKLEELIKVPVLGVIPYIKFNIEDEDSVTDKFTTKNKTGDITIDVIRLPHISNFSDFNALEIYDDVNINYIENPDQIKNPDIIIIPGTKNTTGDMAYLREAGIEKKILEFHKKGVCIIGICGGFQMLGNAIEDSYSIEDSLKEINGMGILDMRTSLAKEKTTVQVSGQLTADSGILKGLAGKAIKGYEIHMGISIGLEDKVKLIKTNTGADGIIQDNIIGTYIHGIFDSAEFTRGLLNNIRMKKNLSPIQNNITFIGKKEEEFNRLADIIRSSIDMYKIYNILNNNDASCS